MLQWLRGPGQRDAIFFSVDSLFFADTSKTLFRQEAELENARSKDKTDSHILSGDFSALPITRDFEYRWVQSAVSSAAFGDDVARAVVLRKGAFGPLYVARRKVGVKATLTITEVNMEPLSPSFCFLLSIRKKHKLDAISNSWF